jgi:hypothetical protein
MVQRDAHQTAGCERQIRLDVGDLVGLQVEHPITGLQPEPVEAGHQCRRPVAELGEGPTAARPLQRDPVAIAAHRPGDDVTHLHPAASHPPSCSVRADGDELPARRER